MSNTNPPDFKGNKIFLFFYDFIFFIIKSYSRITFYLKINCTFLDENTCDKVIFLTRDWGTFTSMNIELFNTLEEYIGAKRLSSFEVKSQNDLISELNLFFQNHKVTHIIFDVRVFINTHGYYGKFKALRDCFYFSLLCKKYGIVPICGITDIIQPGQQMFAELVTYYDGIIVGWGSVGFHEIRLPKHSRVIGPLFLPISLKTSILFNPIYQRKHIEFKISSVGSNYEPRKSFFDQLEYNLKNLSISFYINLKKDLSYIDYLSIYSKSLIGINTSWIGLTHPEKMHFTHRNFEILFAGAALFSQKCFGLDIYLRDGVDYVSYNDVFDLTEKIKYYLANENELNHIAKSGRSRVLELLESNFVWNQINYTLKFNNIKPLIN